MKQLADNSVIIIEVDGQCIGFEVKNGNDQFLPDYYEKNLLEVVEPLTKENAEVMLTGAQEAIKGLGYEVGEVEVKTRKEWCVLSLGVDPENYKDEYEDEYEEQF